MELFGRLRVNNWGERMVSKTYINNKREYSKNETTGEKNKNLEKNKN
jgi:hypothetical protein